MNGIGTTYGIIKSEHESLGCNISTRVSVMHDWICCMMPLAKCTYGIATMLSGATGQYLKARHRVNVAHQVLGLLQAICQAIAFAMESLLYLNA
jgi:hypothetical protein